MTYGYDVGLIGKASSERSAEYARNLLSELDDMRLGSAVSDHCLHIG